MGNTDNNGSEFSGLRSVVWPIHNFELKKFLPMSFLMFTILFVYAAVRDLKDVFVQKYMVFGGMEVTSALKLYFVFPIAILMVMAFSFLVSKFGMQKTFYIVSSFFALFFLLFAFIFFPNRNSIHLSASTMIRMRQSWPSFLYYIIPCLGNWSFSLFFIFAESWGSIAVSSLFWFFANQITKKTEVKRFYAMYSLIGNIGVLLSGSFIKEMSKAKGVAFDHNVKILVSVSALFCILTMVIYSYINKAVLTDPSLYDPSQVKPKKKKAKVGFLAGLKILVSSKYLFLVFVLPMAYGIGMNLFESVWKAQMKETITNANDYASIMGTLSQVTAIATVTLTFLSTYILRKFNWKFAAWVTPFTFIILGLVFFGLMLYAKTGATSFFGVSPYLAAVWIGLFIDAIGKGIKYCLFDTTKSMTYRPLDPETQAQGQGAVEIVGGRGGKAGGALITQLFTAVVFPATTILSHTTGFGVLFIAIILTWIFSVGELGNLYETKMAGQKL